VGRTTVSALFADERVRFLVVGGINTIVGYALFALLQLTVGQTIGVEGTGNRFVDFVRFASVYAVSLAANTVVLPLLVELARLDPLVAQAISVVVTTVVSYFGHKYFSFRRRAGA
jgi:putative flippase GtrA